MSFLSSRFLLRTGLAFTFLYAASATVARPDVWVAFFPHWMLFLLPQQVVIAFFSGFEVLLAVALVLSWFPAITAFIAAMVYAGITLFNLALLDVLFRDIGLACAALALASLSLGEDPVAQRWVARYRSLPSRKRTALWLFLIGTVLFCYGLLGYRGFISAPSFR